MKVIWAICLDEELDNNPDYFIIASDYDSKEEALAAISLDSSNQYSERREFFDPEILKTGEYVVGERILSGAVYKLTKKEKEIQ